MGPTFTFIMTKNFASDVPFAAVTVAGFGDEFKAYKEARALLVELFDERDIDNAWYFLDVE